MECLSRRGFCADSSARGFHNGVAGLSGALSRVMLACRGRLGLLLFVECVRVCASFEFQNDGRDGRDHLNGLPGRV